MDETPLAGLARAIQALRGRAATAEEQRRFARYLELLLIWNRAQRLTGSQSPAAIVRDLFQDSLLFLARIPAGPLRMVDIGAGAGIPGVPLRIVRPEIALTLVESKRKRVSFLASLRRELGLGDVRILEGRAEELVSQESAELLGRFDVVVCRAVSPLPDLLPVAMRYLAPGGSFVTSGPPSESASLRVPEALGIQADTVSFPDLGVSRVFLSAIKG